MAKTDEREAVLHLLVVIDHQEARVYRTEVHGTVPVSIAPYDRDRLIVSSPDGFP